MSKNDFLEKVDAVRSKAGITQALSQIGIMATTEFIINSGHSPELELAGGALLGSLAIKAFAGQQYRKVYRSLLTRYSSEEANQTEDLRSRMRLRQSEESQISSEISAATYGILSGVGLGISVNPNILNITSENLRLGGFMLGVVGVALSIYSQKKESYEQTDQALRDVDLFESNKTVA
jgi:hypothetical protein